jgi:hypothetical protein
MYFSHLSEIVWNLQLKVVESIVNLQEVTRQTPQSELNFFHLVCAFLTAPSAQQAQAMETHLNFQCANVIFKTRLILVS